MTINFKNAAELNAYIENGLPPFDTETVDSLFDAIQSEARRIDSIRAINAFSLVGLEY